jgi:hypothetical protein
VYLGQFNRLTKLGAKWAELLQKVCFHEVASKFFATNAPDPPHCIENSCFGAFRTIWVHFEQFGLLTKLGAKQAELVEKFVPRSRVGISSNDRTRSTPLDPKLMFWCISYYLDAFGTVWLSCETQCKTGRTSAKVRAMKSRSNFPQERTRSTPLDPKLIFWPVLYYLGAFGIVWLAYEARCKTGRTSAKVGNTKSRLNFSQRTHPIHPHWTLNSCFGAFCAIRVYLEPFGCLTKLGAI